MLAQFKKIKISRVTEDLLPEGVPGGGVGNDVTFTL